MTHCCRWHSVVHAESCSTKHSANFLIGLRTSADSLHPGPERALHSPGVCNGAAVPRLSSSASLRHLVPMRRSSAMHTVSTHCGAGVYVKVKFEWSAAKFFWFLFFEILSLTLFTMYGIASVALTPNVVVASIVSGESGHSMIY
jgi:hypothetical protein